MVKGYKLPPLVFTPEEATVLYVGAQLVRTACGGAYGDSVTSVTAKLDNVLPDGLRREAARAQQYMFVGSLTAMDYGACQVAMRALRQAMAERRCVRIVYRGFNKDTSERMVAPYALALQWGLWYLVGHCHLRDEMRTFRVDRIQNIEVTDTPCAVPDGFDVEDYLRRSMRYEPKYTVMVRVARTLVQATRERYGHWMRIEELDDGDIMASYTAATLDWSMSWVLSCGGGASVVAPDELRVEVVAAAERILGRNLEAVATTGAFAALGA